MSNIAFIIPTLSKGGAERVVTTLTNSQNEDIDILVYHRVENEYKTKGNIINLEIDPSPKISGKLVNVVKKVIKLKSIKRKNKYKTLISFLDNPNLINILTMSKSCKTIVSIRNKQSMEYRGIAKIIHRNVVRYFYSKADTIVAISEGVKKDLIDNFGIPKEKVKVIYNPIDLKEIQKLAKLESSININRDSKLEIVTLGRLVEQKGHTYLIKALSEYILNVDKSIHLTILGDGPKNQEILYLIENLKMENYVTIIPFQQNPFSIIKDADLFVLSSIYEGFGNVIVEAVALGLPIISTDCEAGPREILAPELSLNSKIEYPYNNENGVLISPPNIDEDAFKKELIEAIEMKTNEIKSIKDKEKTVNSKLLARFNNKEIFGEWLKL
ncbi:glycosyltransferase [Planococcus maritimus]|nr:glycosyltransferase [Planococcus sp. SK3692]MDE4085890.1 glycosyltransferase [Planococcus maritimus]